MANTLTPRKEPTMAGEDQTTDDTPISLPDAFERYLGRLESEGSDDAPPPSDEASEDTPAGEPEDAPEDTEDEGAEDEGEPEAGEDADDEAAEEDEEEPAKGDQEEEDETEDEESSITVSAEDKARIEADPVLKKAYRSMQADYTRKTTAVARREEVLTERESKIEGIEAAMRDPEKSADFLAGVYKRQPKLAADALTKIATGDMAHEFLVAIGLSDPEVFERALDRVHEIAENPKERARYEKEQADLQRELSLEERENKARQREFDADFDNLNTVMAGESKRLRFDADELAELRTSFKNLVQGRVDKKTGSIRVTAAEVKELVKSERQRLDRIYEKAKAKERSRLAQEAQEATERKAKPKGRLPKPPGAPARKPAREHVRFTPKEGAGDPLDQYVAHRFGT